MFEGIIGYLEVQNDASYPTYLVMFGSYDYPKSCGKILRAHDGHWAFYPKQEMGFRKEDLDKIGSMLGQLTERYPPKK